MKIRLILFFIIVFCLGLFIICSGLHQTLVGNSTYQIKCGELYQLELPDNIVWAELKLYGLSSNDSHEILPIGFLFFQDESMKENILRTDYLQNRTIRLTDFKGKKVFFTYSTDCTNEVTVELTIAYLARDTRYFNSTNENFIIKTIEKNELNEQRGVW